MFSRTVKLTKHLLNQLQEKRTLQPNVYEVDYFGLRYMEVAMILYRNNILELPRAIASECGVPNKAKKCNTIAFYASRYGDHMVTPLFPPGWIPDTVNIEGICAIVGGTSMQV